MGLRRSAVILLAWTLLALFAAALGWAWLTRQLANDLQDAEENALREASIVAHAYARNLFRTLESIDQLTLYVKYGYESSGGKLNLHNIRELADYQDKTALFVSIIDARGRPVTSTLPGQLSEDLSEEGFFTVQKAFGDRRQLYIGHQEVSLVPGGSVFPFSRALAGPDGQFAGVVLVTVRPDYFIAGYDRVTLKDRGFLGILSGDGSLRLARIGDTVVGRSQQDGSTLGKELRGPMGSGLLDAFPDHGQRYSAWHRTEGYDMLTVAGLDREEALAPARQAQAQALGEARTAGIILLALAMLGAAIHLHMARRAAQMERLASTYRTATEGGLEGFFIASPVLSKDGGIEDFLVGDCNAKGAEYLKFRPEQLRGKRMSDIFRGEAGDHVVRMLKAAARDGSYEGEAELSQFGGQEGVWVHLKVTRPENDLAVTMRDITSSKAHVSQLQRQSNEDALTRLPNRHWLNSYLPRLLKHLEHNQQSAAVLFIDLDGFKDVNDNLGHEAGDAVLLHAGKRLREAVRPHDQVARVGGDEFLVVLERLNSLGEAAQVAARIVEEFQAPFMTGRGEASVCASVGVATYPRDGDNAGALLQAADSAMYAVKASGKCGYRFYDKRLADAAREKQMLERDLRRALERDDPEQEELVVYFQPRVAPGSGQVESLEALARWQHPERGLLEPLQFIPLAEDTRLIVQLGKRVIELVCAHMAQWRDAGQRCVPVSLNVSPLQLRDDRFGEHLRQAMKRHGVPPDLIEVEVTESAMADTADIQVLRSVAAIRELGCKLVVDDFGTGYSSLSQLQDLDFDVLKVDRAFTGRLARTEQGNALFKAIIAMAHALDMKVVAEGVETHEQLEELRRLGCDEVQGFLFARPAPAANSEQFFAQSYSV